MASITSYISEPPGDLLLVFGAVFLTTYFLSRQHSVSYGGRKLPPAMPSLPVVGSLPFLPSTMRDLAEFSISPRNKLGKIFSFRLGPKYMVFICGKKAIHEALVVNSLDFADRPEFPSLVSMNISKGIIASRYDAAFRSKHRLCLSIMKRFGFGRRVMETRILTEVEEMINKVREKQGHPFDVTPLTTSCVANVIMSMLFGHRFDHSDPAFQQLISDLHYLAASYSVALHLFPVLRLFPYFIRTTAKKIKALKRNVNFIDNSITACTQKETKADSFVTCFVDARGPDYDREQLQWILRDLILAGMETTATFIRWAIVLLTNHVSVQERLHAEIDSVIGRQRPPTLDDRSNLPYVEATILELLRYKTLVPFAILHYTLNDTEVGGYFIPGGTMVMVNLHSAHMDPDDWQQPQQFRPERFLDDSGNVVGRDRVIAFSLGKRSCLGEPLARQEVFLFLVSLLQNFYFKPPEGHNRIDVNEVWEGQTCLLIMKSE